MALRRELLGEAIHGFAEMGTGIMKSIEKEV